MLKCVPNRGTQMNSIGNTHYKQIGIPTTGIGPWLSDNRYYNYSLGWNPNVRFQDPYWEHGSSKLA